jgi:glycosyltransferase involved in cell wall biosynthesis
MDRSKPLVSVRFMVYNNEPYIREAIEGILMQKTNFLVEIVVGDDFSTDNTLHIIKEYRDTNNVFINILQRDIGATYWKERRRLGRLYNFTNILENCTGKYIALLDGDDYWTDPLKLQKQVDFLEGNPEYSLCFTRAKMLNKGKLNLHPIPFNKTVFLGEDLLKTYNFICTATVVFKAEVIKSNINIEKYPFGDLALHLKASKEGKINCLQDVTAIYRIHQSGLWSRQTVIKQLKMYLDFYKIYYPEANSKEKFIIREKAYEKILKFKTGKGYFKEKAFKLKLIFDNSYLKFKIKPYCNLVFREIILKSKKKINGRKYQI